MVPVLGEMVPVLGEMVPGNGASLCIWLEIKYLSYILLVYRFFEGKGQKMGRIPRWRR